MNAELPTANIQHQKCLNHGEREAVGLCPECHRFYCRECITEHDGKIICQRCIDALITTEGSTSSAWKQHTLAWLGPVFGILILWLSFHLLGQLLLLIPTEFHDGTFWNPN